MSVEPYVGDFTMDDDYEKAIIRDALVKEIARLNYELQEDGGIVSNIISEGGFYRRLLRKYMTYDEMIAKARSYNFYSQKHKEEFISELKDYAEAYDTCENPELLEVVE